jgi:RimJ/RimL family protein N-acetyltransferase
MPRDYLIHRAVEGPSVALPRPSGYRFEFWEPSTRRIVPPGTPRATYSTWWLFHRAHLFKNRDYAVVLAWYGATLAHRLGMFPGWFRFPFMSEHDLQFGDLWTHPAHRGRGLARYALVLGMQRRSSSSRSFWYLTHEGNTASVRTATSAGFELVGFAERTRPWGLSILGTFDMHAAEARPQAPDR